MPDQPREQWATRLGFLLAAIGSAIGLGNIWRFPTTAYENGGGAFLVPYLVALLTAGLPLLILEYTIGRRYRTSAPAAYRQLSRPAAAIGWWQVAIAFVIATYYATILAWAVRYTGFSATEAWGEDAETFFSADFLETTDPGTFGDLVPGVMWPLLGMWALVIVILAFGIRRGIEVANKIFIPLLLVFFLVLVVRALTLDGAAKGLDAFFKPDWSELGNGTVWVEAYGQIFFSLSIGFGIMITYASYLGRRADLSGSALVAGFANSSFEILAGIGVFATLGFMASASGVGVDEVVEGGVGLAFVAFPEIVSQMPAGPFFGVMFFLSLVIAGLTSLVSIVQVVVSAVQDRTGLARVPAVFAVCIPLTVVSVVLFATQGGLPLLDAADNFINQYGIVVAGLVEVVVLAWVLRRLPAMSRNANATSAVRIGRLWMICLGVITPVMLTVMTVKNFQDNIDETYGGYPSSFVAWAGWGTAAAALVVGIVLALLPWRNAPRTEADDADEAAAAAKGGER